MDHGRIIANQARIKHLDIQGTSLSPRDMITGSLGAGTSQFSFQRHSMISSPPMLPPTIFTMKKGLQQQVAGFDKPVSKYKSSFLNKQSPQSQNTRFLKRKQLREYTRKSCGGMPQAETSLSPERKLGIARANQRRRSMEVGLRYSEELDDNFQKQFGLLQSVKDKPPIIFSPHAEQNWQRHSLEAPASPLGWFEAGQHAAIENLETEGIEDQLDTDIDARPRFHMGSRIRVKRKPPAITGALAQTQVSPFVPSRTQFQRSQNSNQNHLDRISNFDLQPSHNLKQFQIQTEMFNDVKSKSQMSNRRNYVSRGQYRNREKQENSRRSLLSQRPFTQNLQNLLEIEVSDLGNEEEFPYTNEELVEYAEREILDRHLGQIKLSDSEFRETFTTLESNLKANGILTGTQNLSKMIKVKDFKRKESVKIIQDIIQEKQLKDVASKQFIRINFGNFNETNNTMNRQDSNLPKNEDIVYQHQHNIIKAMENQQLYYTLQQEMTKEMKHISEQQGPQKLEKHEKRASIDIKSTKIGFKNTYNNEKRQENRNVNKMRLKTNSDQFQIASQPKTTKNLRICPISIQTINKPLQNDDKNVKIMKKRFPSVHVLEEDQIVKECDMMNEIGKDAETGNKSSSLEIDWKVLSHKKNMILPQEQTPVYQKSPEKMNNDLNTVLTPNQKAQIAQNNNSPKLSTQQVQFSPETIVIPQQGLIINNMQVDRYLMNNNYKIRRSSQLLTHEQNLLNKQKAVIQQNRSILHSYAKVQELSIKSGIQKMKNSKQKTLYKIDQNQILIQGKQEQENQLVIYVRAPSNNSVEKQSDSPIILESNNNNQVKEFQFQKNLLLKYMKLFKDQDIKQQMTIEHDPVVFEWLLKSILIIEDQSKSLQLENSSAPTKSNSQKRSNQFNSQLLVKSIISKQIELFIKQHKPTSIIQLLESSTFFKCDLLIQVCQHYFITHIQDLSLIKMDFKVKNKFMLHELAKKVSLEKLNILNHCNQVINCLFKVKFLQEIKNKRISLVQCKNCLQLYTKSCQDVLHCNYGSDEKFRHEPDEYLDFVKFLIYFRATYKVSWREIYWKVWSYIIVFKCDRCSKYYQLSQIRNCHVNKTNKSDQMQHNYHSVQERQNLDPEQEKLIINRIIAYQMIIIDNIQCQEQSIINKLSQGQIHIIKPKSINFQISLNNAILKYNHQSKPIQYTNVIIQPRQSIQLDKIEELKEEDDSLDLKERGKIHSIQIKHYSIQTSTDDLNADLSLDKIQGVQHHTSTYNSQEQINYLNNESLQLSKNTSISYRNECDYISDIDSSEDDNENNVSLTQRGFSDLTQTLYYNKYDKSKEIKTNHVLLQNQHIQKEMGSQTPDSMMSEVLIDISLISNFKINKRKHLGSGGQAQVFECEIEEQPGNHFATKIRQAHDNDALSNQTFKEAYHEFELGSNIDHPYIIKYLHLVKSQTNKLNSYHIVTELVQGQDLATYLNNNGPLKDISAVTEIARQLLEAIDYIHSLNIVHLDIKPSNIMLLSDNESIKLIDFGISQYVEIAPIKQYNSVQGTFRYLAQEQLNQKIQFSSDIWQFGCVLLQLLTGAIPYQQLDNVACMEIIRTGQSPLDYILKDSVNYHVLQQHQEFKEMLMQCFAPTAQRASAKKLLQSTLFKDEIIILKTNK